MSQSETKRMDTANVTGGTCAVTAGREVLHRQVPPAQLEDLLIALADRRSFPETRFLVERGIVGETWSTESAAPAVVPASVLVLPVKEPGEGWREMEKGRGGGLYRLKLRRSDATRELDGLCV